MCDMTHSRAWNDSFTCATWLVTVSQLDNYKSISGLPAFMSHDTYMNKSCRTYEWLMLHIWMIHFTHIHESCHLYDSVMTHIWMSHVTHMNESCKLRLPAYVTWLICMCDLLIHTCDMPHSTCDMTHSYEPWHIITRHYMCDITQSYV